MRTGVVFLVVASLLLATGCPPQTKSGAAGTQGGAGKTGTAKGLAGKSNEDLIAILKDKNMDNAVRAEAARQLGMRKASAAASMLGALLKEKAPIVRKHAVEALIKLGPKAKKATKALVQALKEKDIQIKAASALGKVASKEAASALGDVLKTDAPQPPQLQLAAAGALVNSDTGRTELKVAFKSVPPAVKSRIRKGVVREVGLRECPGCADRITDSVITTCPTCETPLPTAKTDDKTRAMKAFLRDVVDPWVQEVPLMMIRLRNFSESEASQLEAVLTFEGFVQVQLSPEKDAIETRYIGKNLKKDLKEALADVEMKASVTLSGQEAEVIKE